MRFNVGFVHRSHKVVGLTLIELLITLSILATVFMFTVPWTSLFSQKNQLHVRAVDIQTAIRFAKVQSLSYGKPLLLVPLLGQSDWTSGMVLIVDNPSHRYNPRATLLRAWHWHVKGIEVMWRGFQSADYLRFANDINHNATNGYFLIKSPHQSVKLIINRFARVRVEALGFR